MPPVIQAQPRTGNQGDRRVPQGPHPANARCEHCDGMLTLHQPDPDTPDELLGTCDLCQTWYFVGLAASQTDPVLVELGAVAEGRAMIAHAKRANGGSNHIRG